MRRRQPASNDWNYDAPPEVAPRRSAQTRPPRPRRERPLRIDVLAADDAIAVLDKPAGLPMTPDDDGADVHGDALTGLAARLGAPLRSLRVVERIDAEVSGVLMVARSAEAEKSLVAQLRGDGVQRAWLAIVRAAPLDPEGRIDLAIGADRRRPNQVRIGGPTARPAVTQWRLRDRFAGFALLECVTQGERRHQVRLHLQAAGLPLAVDPLYGGQAELLLSSFKPDYHPSRRRDEQPLMARVSLHSLALEFAHPSGGRRCRFEAAPPKDFRATLNQLDKHGRIGLAP